MKNLQTTKVWVLIFSPAAFPPVPKIRLLWPHPPLQESRPPHPHQQPWTPPPPSSSRACTTQKVSEDPCQIGPPVSTLAMTGAALPCNAFQIPYIKASSTPWWTNPPNSPMFGEYVSNQNKPPNLELMCISSNQNIFQIVEESKAHCKGQDYRVNFYLQTDEDYTKLDSLLIDKHLFHNLLMKYSDWSLTTENIGSINEKKTIKHDRELNYDDNLRKDNLVEHYKAPTISASHTKWPIIVRLLEKDKRKGPKNRNFVYDDLDHQDIGNTQSETINEKDKKYHTINPSYNSKYKVYEVSLPEYKDTSSPKTMNVYIDKNIENDEYDAKVIDSNKSYTQERKKSDTVDQSISLKDFVKNHKISEIIDILFNDDNVSSNTPILFDCTGTDADIINSDVKLSYSSGDLPEYHDDINGYFKNVDIDETILDSSRKQVNQEPQVVETLDTCVITDTADATVDSSAIKDNSDELNNYYYNLPFNKSSQTKELLTDEGTIPLITTSHSVNANTTILSSPSDNLTFTEITKQHNILTLPSTEAKNAESIEYVPYKYSHDKILNEIPCEYDDKNSADSYIQDISSPFTPNYEIQPQESPLFQYHVNNYSPDNSKTVQKLIKPSSIKVVLDTDHQEPFYITGEIPFIVNPEDYPMQPQIVYSETVPIEDMVFYINDNISEAPSIPSDTDTDAYYEESTKPSLDHGIPSIVVHDLEMPVSELSQKPQPVSIITSPHIVVEPLSDSQKSKTMELTNLSQISSTPKLKPNEIVIDTRSSKSSTTISPSINATPFEKPFIKKSQLSIPQNDASLASTISFSQLHLPEIIEIKKPTVFTPTNPMSPLPQCNINFKAPKITPYYSTPLIFSKTSKSKPLTVSPVLPTTLKPFPSFYSSDSQNMLHKSDSSIPSLAMEIIPALLPVRNATISATNPNLQPVFTPLNIANPQNNTYTEVTKPVPEIISTPGKEPLMIRPLPVHQVKPVHHVEEPCVDLLPTVPIEPNYLPNLNLPPATPPSHIYLLPSITSSATVSPLNYKNQIPKETFEATASPATNKLLCIHKCSQPTLYPISSVPTPTSTISFYTASPSIQPTPTFWQSIPELQHLLSKPIKPPLPEISTVASYFTYSPTLPIYTNLPEITQFTEQPTTTFSIPISNKPISYIPKLNSYKPSFDEQHYHIPSPTDFLLPITQNFTKLSHPTAQSTTNGQLQNQFLITKLNPNNIVSNVMTYTQQPTEPYVESRIANQSMKGSSLISTSLKAVPLFDKILRVASPSSALEPLISTSTNYLSETSTPTILPYASELTPLTNIEFQTRASILPLMLPTKAYVTPLTSKQAIDLSYSSLTYSDYLTDKKNSLYSSFEPITSSLSVPSARSTKNLNPVDIMPKIISEFSMPVKDSKLKSAFSTLLPSPADSSTTPHVSPYQKYWQVVQPNLFKSYAPYIAPFKAKIPFPPKVSSTTLLPYLRPVKPVSEIAIPFAKDNLPNQPAILNKLSGFPLSESNVDVTPFLESEIIPLKPVPDAHSTVLSTAPVEVTKSRILSTIRPARPVNFALPTPPTAFYTSSMLSKGNRQSAPHLKWSESLPIYNKPQWYIPQLACSALSTPLPKEESPSLSSDSSTITCIPIPVTTTVYSTALSGTLLPDKVNSPLSYPVKQPPTLSYTYQAGLLLPSPIPMAKTKPEDTLRYKLSEPLTFVTPLSYANSVLNNIPNVRKSSESFNFQEIMPCIFKESSEEISAPLSPATYYRSLEKAPKATSVWFTPNQARNKMYPSTYLSPVKTIAESKISLDTKNIPSQAEIQAIPTPSLPSYTSPLLKPTPLSDTVSTAFRTLPLEETTSSIIPSPSLQQKGKLPSALRSLEYAPLLSPVAYGPELFQNTVQRVPLRSSTLTTSNFLQPKDVVSSHETHPIYLPKSSPISASCLLETIPEGLKPLKLNNADPPKWRWSDISSSSPTIPITYITPVPLHSEFIVSNIINPLEALPEDEVSKPLPHSYFPKHKPVYTESQSFSNTLSIPILTVSPVESVEPLLQVSNINKPKYTYSKSVSGLPQRVLNESEYISQIISPLQPSELVNKPIEIKQSPVINKYTTNFLKPLSQTVSTSQIDTNVPILLPKPATPLSLLYRRPQKSKPCQWFSPSLLQTIKPTSAIIDSDIQLHSPSNLSKESELAVEPLYYQISETGVEIPATSTSSPILPHTIVNKPLKVMSTFSGYNSNAANLQTPAIQLTDYPTSTLSDPKWKPGSNFYLASYPPMTISTETLNPELSIAQYSINALESNAPVKLLPASKYTLAYFHTIPISPFPPILSPVSNLLESSSLKTPVYTAPLKDSELNCLPLPKLPVPVPYVKPIPFASPLKQNSQYVTPLQSTYSPQSISDSLPQPLSASNLKQISSPNFSKLTPYIYAPLNVPRYIPSTTAPLSTPLSKQKFYEYKPTPHSVSDRSSVTPTKPSLLDSAITSSDITPQISLSQAIGPESSQNLPIKPLFSKNTIPLQHVSSKMANLALNLSKTPVQPVSSTCSRILNKNLLVPTSSPINPMLPVINTPTYVNTPLNINMTEKQTSPTFVPITTYLQPKWLSPLPSKIDEVAPILPTIPSAPVQTSLSKSNTILDPQKLIPPTVTPVPSYLPMPTSSSQTTSGRYLYTIPCYPNSSPVKSSVSYTPIKILDPYAQYYEPHFTCNNVGPLQNPFTKYSSPLKHQSYYPSICPLYFAKPCPKPQSLYLSSTSSSSYTSSQPVFTSLVSTQKKSPYKYIFPIKRGQFGLIYPTPHLKPYTNAHPICSNVVTAPITTTDYKPFTNYMSTNSIASSSKPAMSTMSLPPVRHPSELLAVTMNPVLPVASTEVPNDYTEHVVAKLPSPDIKLKSDNDFIAPVFSSLPKISSTLNTLPLSSKLNSLMRSELVYSQTLPMRASDVLPNTSPTVISQPFKQSSYYPSTYTDIDLKKDSNIVINSNTPLPALKSLQPTDATPLLSTLMPASTQHITSLLKPISSNPSISSKTPFTKTYPLYSSLASNTDDYTPIKPLITKIFAISPKSKIAVNSNPYSNIALSPVEVSAPLKNGQFEPLNSAEYMTPESVSLKTATNIVSPLSYSQPTSSKTVTQPAQNVTPPSMPVSSTLQSYSPYPLLKPICSQLSSLQYSPIITPVSSFPTYMPIEPSQFPVHSTLTHTPTYENKIPLTSQSSIFSLPLRLVSLLTTQEPLIKSKGFSSLPPILSSQFSSYSSTSTEYENMPLIEQNPIAINTALHTKFIQPHNYVLLSTREKASSPLELIPSIESLPTSSPLPIPINPSSSLNLPRYNTFQSFFKPNLPTDLTLANFYFPNIYKTNEKSPPYNTATYPTLNSELTSVVSKEPTSDTDYFSDSLFKTYPSQPEYVSGKPFSQLPINQFCDNNLRTVSKTNNFLPLQKEMNSKLYNYVKNNDNIKTDIHNSNVDVSIPVGNILVAKKDCDDPMVYTINPSVGLKMWPSNLKLLEAKLELKFKDVSVTNFQPIVNDLATHDVNEVVNLIKNYIQNKYGKVIVLDNNNYLNNKYEVIKHCGSVNNKCNLLWPVDTSYNSAKPIVKYKGVV